MTAVSGQRTGIVFIRNTLHWRRRLGSRIRRPRRRTISRSELTFPHPSVAWRMAVSARGTAKSNRRSFGYTFPGRFGLAKPLYVVYVGPKITKR